ncbi:carboxypeptidase S [Coleophoma cylindrospora]|uniref:Carboxypeptidase S n=1 Tax=Coleophoma cylindrospora TaxID=1849047 RepID=A0A3D8SPK3_9HELO|nr:carboxypeptidase S [Coleophoma cylindrospora]
MGTINEKGLPTTQTPPSSSRHSKVKTATTVLLGLLSLGYVVTYRSTITESLPGFKTETHPHDLILKSQCQQVDPILPQKTTPELDQILDTISTPGYKNQSIEYLSNAVKIPTVSRDVMGKPGEDERWEIFYEFHDYLESTFPLVHGALELQKVNTHGLLYTWKGTDASLKPTLLMAHYDVVPVPEATIPTWTYPPFSGFFDGKQIWGRGSSDDKNQLVAIFEAVELLLKADFTPERTVLISLGFDEESAGTGGAGSLSTVILDKYGKDSIAIIVDEGSGVSEIWGHTFASVGVAEKGSVNVLVTVRMPGGHSSVPPPHTSIGVMSELVSLIEASTYQTFLDDKNPYYSQLVCGANHAPDFPKPLKKLLSSSKKSHCGRDVLAEEAAKESLFTKYLMTTSIAVDVIVGGEKSNALPEESTLIVNHRVNIGDSVSHVTSKIASLAEQVATKHNLSLNAYTGKAPFQQSITLAAPHYLEVAPVTPTSVDTLTPYSILSGTTRALYGEDLIVAPGLMTGNTDTRFFWDLTQHIFRFAPGYGGKGDGKGGVGKIHTVDESVSVENHFAAVKWFVLFIRNMDEAKFE